MSLYSELARRSAALFGRRRLESEMDDELRFHLEQDIERRVAGGATPEAARREARVAFGSLDRVREECRDAWGTRRLDELGRDLRLAARAAGRQPLQTLFLVGVLAIGIGSATANFGLVRAYLWRDLPYRAPEELVHLFRYEKVPQEKGRFALTDLSDLARDSATLEQIEAYYYGGVNLRHEGAEPIRTMAAYLTPNLLTMLGVDPVLGRGFAAADGVPGAGRVVLLSGALHRELFAGRDDALGQTLLVDGAPHTVVGVLPRDESFPFGEVRLWLPVELDVTRYETSWENFQPVARLRPGASREAAASELSARIASIEAARGLAERESRVAAWPLREALIFEFPLVRAMMWLITAAHGALLLLIASTAGGILLARLRVRERDLAVRAALGAGRRRVVSQLVTEAGAIVVAGGVAGVALAYLWTPQVARSIPEALFRAAAPTIDPAALLFAFGAVAVASIFAAVLPAVRATRLTPADALRRAGRSGAGRGSHRLRDGLVLMQIGAAALLAIVAVILQGSILEMRQGARSLTRAPVLTLEVELPSGKYEDSSAIARIQDRLLEELEASPAARSASWVDPLPLNFETYSVEVEIASGDGETRSHEVAFHRASGGFFDAFGQPLLAGRTFDSRDQPGSPPVIVVNQAFRRRLFGDADPIGRRFRLPAQVGSPLEWVEVIGVVSDAPTQSFSGAGEPTLYFAMSQRPRRRAFLVVAAAGALEPAVGDLRSTVRRIDPDLPTTAIRSLPQVLREALAPWQIGATSLGALALFALVLASLGLHGVVAQVVAERQFELGLRAALGADARSLMRLVLRRGVRLIGVGLLLGGALSIAAWKLLRSILSHLTAGALGSTVAVPLVLAAVALAAMLGPALRAARTDPATTLRAE